MFNQKLALLHKFDFANIKYFNIDFIKNNITINYPHKHD